MKDLDFMKVALELSSTRSIRETIAILCLRINKLGGDVMFEAFRDTDTVRIYDYKSVVNHITSSHVLREENESEVFDKLLKLYIELQEEEA